MTADEMDQAISAAGYAELTTALRAVLDLHHFYDQCDEDCCRYCESCEQEWPCDTSRAIEAALGDAA